MSYTALGGLNLKTQSSLGAWRLKNIALAPARGAFLALVRLNVWGLAKLFSIKLFFVSDAVTATQSVPNMWWDLQAKMRNGWWNLGGKWDALVRAIDAGKNKKAKLFFLAPKQIKARFKAQGISGCQSQGIGAVDPATLTAIGAAAAIIGALTPLIMLIVNQSNLKKDLANRESETEAAREEAALNRQFELNRLEKGSGSSDFSLTNYTGKLTTAGYGAIGVGVLGLLFVGTALKNRKKK
jgi:hypothetical protein